MGRYQALTFDTVESRRDRLQLEEFLSRHPATYNLEDYYGSINEKWLPALERGDGSALAFWQDSRMVGDAVLMCAGLNTVKIKNFRKADLVTSDGGFIRGTGRFMMTQTFTEAPRLLERQGMISSEANTITVQLDTTKGTPAERFFAYLGFEAYGEAELYVPGQTEVLMSKQVALD